MFVLNNDVSQSGVSQIKGESPYLPYASLQDLLNQGWKIEPPVYARPPWRTCSRSTKQQAAYHFVLWRGGKVNLVSVRDSAELRQFLAEGQLAIDHRGEETFK